MAKKKTTLIRVFTASPGDVHDERQRAAMVIDEVGRAVGPPHNIQLEPVRWETHAWPDIGEDAQDVINRQISPFDVLVGIMWRRFGTRTKRAESGTEEEFKRGVRIVQVSRTPEDHVLFSNGAVFSNAR